LAVYGTPIDGGPDGPRAQEKSASGDSAKVKLGRYEVVRELGKGAMGIVYLAKDPLIGRLVALKTIRPAAHADDDETKEFQQRFLREAQAAGILNHPAIVTVHDIGQDDTTGVSFIAMEYVEGQNLKEVLQQGRPLNFEQIGDIVAQVAEGLDFAHAKGIVHRDVKPANIILIEGMRAKITDFGIAKIASGVSNLTTTGQFLGTPNYMAPEQIKGAPVDGRSDIFSLGICLYECLTRRKPFGGDSLTSISYKIVHEPFPPLQEINPQIPTGFEEVVAKCLAKEPAKRYQRARDLAIALRAVNRGERPPVEVAEETIITRGHEKIPTVEIPFPDDVEETPAPLTTNPNPTAAPAAAVAARASAAASPRAQLRRTLTNVRALPLWRRQLHPALFLGIVAFCFLALGGVAIALKARAPRPPSVDVRAEQQHARERQLREQANALLRQGRVNDAYAKYAELNRMAPSSPAVVAMLQKLNGIRAQEEIGRQQQANAKAKFDEGMALFNQKKFAESIPLFSEAFSLNPNSDDAAKYLKLAQQEQQNLEDTKAAQAKQRKLAATTPAQQAHATTTAPVPQPHPTATGGDGAGNHAAANNAAPVQFNTFFNSPFNDGYVMVKVGADIILREQIFTESRFLHRKSPRSVNVTNNLTPKNTDIEIWVVVPSQQIQEHHTLSRVNLQPGSAHRLTITADAASKKFDYSLN
jgi:predicted Ser/Thr protein kinase/tetratricopeptide (TPR) repeat protein